MQAGGGTDLVEVGHLGVVVQDALRPVRTLLREVVVALDRRATAVAPVGAALTAHHLVTAVALEARHGALGTGADQRRRHGLCVERAWRGSAGGVARSERDRLTGDSVHSRQAALLVCLLARERDVTLLHKNKREVVK